VEPSVFQLHTGPRAAARRPPVLAIRSSWRAVGTAARLVTAAGLLASVAFADWWVRATPAAVATGATLVVLTMAALVDAACHRLPNALVALAAVPVVVAAAASWSAGLLWGALVGAALLGGPLLLTHVMAPAGMGFGDVKAGLVLGAAVGLVAAPISLLALVVGLALGAVVGLARRAGSIALGPALVAGALLALAAARLVDVVPITP
jgi:leader peptidase (prepilin peptidase) / N-methyltransferase